jgi:hypothetical protein
VQAFPAHRNQPSAETVTVGATTFNEDSAAVDVTFGASGVTDLTATSSVDPNAIGKARVVVP